MRPLFAGPLVLSFVVATASVAGAAITTQPVSDGGPTADALVNQVLGSGVTISNVSSRGCTGGLGTFAGGTGIVGIESGIILSSGDIANVVGPNDVPDAGTECGIAGDADLDALLHAQPGATGATTLDAAVLEFDFVPTGSTVAFQYVFASEEYPEFVGSDFNDVFGFFVNGQNYATVPGTNLPVAVNNVNGGDPSGSFAPVNEVLFVDNEFGDFDTQADGFTQALSFTAPVNAGVTNHIKLAIGDTSDGKLDSWIFIAAQSLSSTPAEVGVKPKGTTPVVDCDAGATGRGLGVCEAGGFAIVPGAASTADDAVATGAPVLTAPAGLTAVTKSLRQKFNRKGHAKIKLTLNKAGKKILRNKGSMQVLVLVKVTDAQGKSVQFQRLLQLLKKKFS